MSTKTTTEPHEYTDFATHFEDCPYCTAAKPCQHGKRLQFMDGWRQAKLELHEPAETR